MKIVFIICIIIVIVILLLSVLTTSKAYQYKHTIDPIKKSDKQQNKEKSDQQ